MHVCCQLYHYDDTDQQSIYEFLQPRDTWWLTDQCRCNHAGIRSSVCQQTQPTRFAEEDILKICFFGNLSKSLFDILIQSPFSPVIPWTPILVQRELWIYMTPVRSLYFCRSDKTTEQFSLCIYWVQTVIFALVIKSHHLLVTFFIHFSCCGANNTQYTSRISCVCTDIWVATLWVFFSVNMSQVAEIPGVSLSEQRPLVAPWFHSHLIWS